MNTIILQMENCNHEYGKMKEKEKGTVKKFLRIGSFDDLFRIGPGLFPTLL